MKKFVSLLLCLAGTGYLFAQRGFVVRATILNPNNYTVFLAYPVNGKSVIDTNYVVENGTYIFKGQVPEPVIAHMGVRGNPALIIKNQKGTIPGPSLTFFLENERIEITGDADSICVAFVEGGQANKDWAKIKQQETQLTQQSWLGQKQSFESLQYSTDSSLYKKINQENVARAKQSMALRKQFIDDNPNSLVSTYFLSNLINVLSFADLKVAYEKLNDAVKSNLYAKRIADKIEGVENTSIGKAAIAIDKKDVNGNPVNLQTLQGKYVLLDFWGSWCMPCRASHPHLKELYEKYKNQGFEIVGIAQENGATLAENQMRWKEAINKDAITWVHVLNNENIDAFDAVKSYGVSAFPTKILLGKDGKIIDRYVGEEKERFDSKLKELFGN